MNWRIPVVVASLAVLGTAAPAKAVELEGLMGISGSVTVNATTIDWFPDGTGTGLALVGPPTAGYFSNPGNGGPSIYTIYPTVITTEKDLDLAVTGIGVDTSVTGFLSGFNSFNTEYSDLTFELTKIVQPTAILGECQNNQVYATGESCWLGAFLLTQNNGSVTVSLNIEGIFRDPSLGLTSLLATGKYTTQELTGFDSNGNPVALNTIDQLGDFLEAGGNVSATYSATFTVPAASQVPEPASLVLFGTGAALLGGLRRRRAKK